MRSDLILLHAPHVYDFRKLPLLYGPVSDLVPSTPAFEMYPMGFTSFAEYLGRYGYKVRICNLALRMVQSKSFDAEKYISKLKAPIFGIDLHWLVHANGAIEFSKIVKKYHPESKVVIGGFSASYFKDELIKLDSVDFVLSGDSTELPMKLLLDNLKTQQFENIPNLSWKKNGQIIHNEMSNIPSDLTNVMHEHYEGMITQVLKYKSFKNIIPFKGWLKQPETCVFTCRGCDQYCVFCGGSKYAMQRMADRRETAYRTVDDMVNDIVRTSKISRGQIALESDIRQGGGLERAYEFLDALEKEHIKNQIMFEMFTPAPTELMERIAKAVPNFSIDISPNSHDYDVRLATGINYTNTEMEQMIADALRLGAKRIEIFFMIGLPKQTKQSVLATVRYCDELLTKFNGDKRIFTYIGPLSPYLDPGSIGYEEPEKHGYKLKYHTLDEYQKSLTNPSWRYALNYETEWMTRDDIMDVTYEAIMQLTEVKAMHGQLSSKVVKSQNERIHLTKELEKDISEIIKSGDTSKLMQLKPRMDAINNYRSIQQSQMDIAYGLIKLRYLNGLIQGIKSELHKNSR